LLTVKNTKDIEVIKGKMAGKKIIMRISREIALESVLVYNGMQICQVSTW